MDNIMNPLAIVVAAVAALAIGAAWYHPKAFGTAWMRESGMTAEKMQKGNMAVIFGVALIFSALLALLLVQFTNHQFGAVQMIGGDPSTAKPSFEAFMADYGTAFRSAKHGALHGALFAILGALPILGTNALFERKSWKYIFINVGYWLVTLAVMGAILCGWQ